MRTLCLSVMILMSLILKSQTIEVFELDSAISKADSLIESNPRIFFKNVESFIVYFDGNIRFEEYYNGFNRDSLHLIQSQTKSIVSLLFGIAIDKGFVLSDNEPIIKFFPDYFKSTDSLKSKLKIRDVLTMSAGIDWEEMLPIDNPKNDNINMFNSNDYLNYILLKSVSVTPSTEFKYTSGCPMIIAGIIEKTSKMSLDKFAELYLFKPLEITKYRWIKDTTGFCHAGGGLYLKPIDMLKIGILVANNGKWNNRQIISKGWIQKVIKPYLKTNFENSDYGYFWWIKKIALGEGKTTTIISAEGAGGQKLHIFPDYNLIVAFTERNFTTPQVCQIFIKESIIPLLK